MAIRTVYDTHKMLSAFTHAQLSRRTHAWLHSHTEEVPDVGKITEGGKLLAYVLSAEDLTIKDLLEFETFEFKLDTEFANKSKIVVAAQPNIAHDDFVICKCAGETVFTGICENWASESDNSAYTITLRQKENLFDRFIFINNEALISSTGVEDFVAQAITDNWISSGDAMLDRSYLTVTALTHTPVNAKVSTTVSLTEGAFNLKTYLGNILEFYKIYIDFDFSTEGRLALSIYQDMHTDLSIDVLLTDIAEYNETYSVDALTKLNVRYDQKEGEEIVATEYYTYYLLANRSVTTDATNPNRASGRTRSMVIEAESYDEMYQKVVDEFSKNSYTHKINFNLFMDSNLYDYRDFYIGRNTEIKTKSGIRSSLVTAQSIASNSRFAAIAFGKLKVTLIEKIRSMA